MAGHAEPSTVDRNPNTVRRRPRPSRAASPLAKGGSPDQIATTSREEVVKLIDEARTLRVRAGEKALQIHGPA